MKMPTVIAGVIIAGGVAAFLLLWSFRGSSPAPFPLPAPTAAPTSSPPPPRATEERPNAEPAPPTSAPNTSPPTPSSPPTPQVEPLPAPREPEEFVVKIHSFTRYEPADLTIHAGDTVTFVNEDDELHWPGADPHPTHSALPTFDATGGISKGQSYSYTFRAPGAFGHHDHLDEPDPPTLGIITVLP